MGRAQGESRWRVKKRHRLTGRLFPLNVFTHNPRGISGPAGPVGTGTVKKMPISRDPRAGSGR